MYYIEKIVNNIFLNVCSTEDESQVFSHSKHSTTELYPQPNKVSLSPDWL